MRNSIEHSLRIADINFHIKTIQNLIKSEAFSDFIMSHEEQDKAERQDWIFQFQENIDLQIPVGVLVFKSGEYSVYLNGAGNYIRVFFDIKNNRQAYAFSVIDMEKKNTQITYLPSANEYFNELSNCFYHSCWEKVMSLYGRFVFHSACIRMGFGGVLFSGPSGIGKSTQADLWIRYENAELINGDRTILYTNETGEWMAAGSPYAGSSKCYKNEQCPVKAIVMLKQSEKCSIRRLGLAEGFRKIYQQCTVYSWDNEFVQKICDLVENICIRIPVYEYSCNISKEAVYMLKQELEVD